MNKLLTEVLVLSAGSALRQAIQNKPLDLGTTISDVLIGKAALTTLHGLDNLIFPPRKLDSKTEVVWNKRRKKAFRNPSKVGEDACGKTIKRNHHGRRDVKTGWEKDHMQSKKDGGSDEPCNMQPLQYEMNIVKGGDSWPNDCNS